MLRPFVLVDDWHRLAVECADAGEEDSPKINGGKTARKSQRRSANGPKASRPVMPPVYRHPRRR